MNDENMNATTDSDKQIATLLKSLVMALVDDPTQVEVCSIRSDQTTIFEIKVDSEDVRRPITPSTAPSL